MSASPSIAVVVPFFGRVPLWMPAFLRSCRTNPDVQWLVYADFEVTFTVPPNVVIRPLDLHGFNARASEVLGAPVRIEPAALRKTNDVKPLYGLMFADDLRGYDWWAYSDLDIVWGDIRRFMTPEILDAHDIVSSRDGKISGPFTLFRNTADVNRTFEIIPDFATELARTEYLHIDEKVLTRHLRHRRDRLPQLPSPRIYWQQELTMSADYQRGLPDDERGCLWWIDGRTFDAEGRELMYLHFHKLKGYMTTMDFGYEDLPDAFAIRRSGIAARIPATRVS